MGIVRPDPLGSICLGRRREWAGRRIERWSAAGRTSSIRSFSFLSEGSPEYAIAYGNDDGSSSRTIESISPPLVEHGREQVGCSAHEDQGSRGGSLVR
jgi:hypothetical protein